MLTININLTSCIGYACRANNNPYRHDSRADKNPYRHDRRADKNPYRHDCRADSQCLLFDLDSFVYLQVWLPTRVLADSIGRLLILNCSVS